MHEQLRLVESYIRGVWRFRWYGLAFAWLVAIAGWVLAFQAPNQYQSSAQVHVDTESMLKPLMRGLVVDFNVERRVELMTRTLLTRPNLERIARETDLDLQGPPEELDAIVDALDRALRLSGTGRDNLYRISYRGDDPRLARDVVQATVNLFIEENLGRSREDSDSATRFLDRKIEEYRNRLGEVEQRRLEFRREHADILSASGGDYYAQLQRRQGELEEARFHLEATERRIRELERQLAGETPTFGIMDETGPGGSAEVATPELDQRIARLREQLDELWSRYTEQHPRVRSLQGQLERAEEEREEVRAELAARQATDVVSRPHAIERNPVYQTIRADLSRLRGEAESLRAQVERRAHQVEALEHKVEFLPGLEAALESLAREHRAVERTYTELVERRKTAEISEEVERSEDQVEFRVVEPPRVEPEPVAPNRPLLVTASLGGALAGYGALGLLLTLIWPAFHTRTGLGDSLQLPVLGAIERVRTARTRLVGWVGVLGHALVLSGLLAVYGLIMLLLLAPESRLAAQLPLELLTSLPLGSLL